MGIAGTWGSLYAATKLYATLQVPELLSSWLSSSEPPFPHLYDGVIRPRPMLQKESCVGQVLSLPESKSCPQ